MFLSIELITMFLSSEFYKSEISRDIETIDGLLNDSAELEKFGREQYLMKRENEDIFLVVKKPTEEQ